MGKSSTAVVKSRALVAGELYDEHGAPIAAVIDATPTTHSGGSGGNGAGPGTRLNAVPANRPSLGAAVKAIPTWGWVAIAAAVAIGANAVLGGDESASDEYDVDLDEDDVDVEEDESVVAA